MTARQHLGGLLPRPADYALVGRSWRGDVIAGITVGIVALPLALAFGVSSGAGAAAGLVTAIVAGLVAAVFGGSNVQVSGPTGAMVVVLGPIVAVHGAWAVPVVTVMAGAVIVAAGVLKLGRTVTLIPWPVIEGFTLGIAIIIFLQQVPAAFGVTAGASSNAALAAVQGVATASSSETAWALVTAAAVVAIMVLASKLHKVIPGSIIAIIVVTAVAEVAHLPVARIGELPSALPVPSVPGFTWGHLVTFAGPALTVAALAAIESLLSARVAATLADTGEYNADRELIGQGLASLASGFLGGMPATGAIARTAVNVRTGGRTRLAAIIHAVVLVGVVYLATGPVSRIPLAALAGVLMLTAVRMIAPATIRSVVGSTHSDTVVFITTVIITVSFDLIYAVGIGIAVTAFFALRTLARSSGVHREQLPGHACAGDQHIALFRLDGALFFGAAERVIGRVKQIADVDVVILRMSQLQVLDATGARVITELITGLEQRGITVLIKGIQKEHLQLVARVGVVSALRDHRHLFEHLDEAVAHARSHVARRGSASDRATQKSVTAISAARRVRPAQDDSS